MHAVYLRAPHLYDLISGDPAWMHVNINHKRRCFFVALDGEAEFVFHPQLKPGEDKVTEVRTTVISTGPCADHVQ